MLIEAGINPDECFSTNLIAAHPQENETWRFFEPGPATYRGLAPTPFAKSELERLWEQLRTIRPQIVIAAGNWSLWATTDCASTSTVPNGLGATVRVPAGITSWRGSQLISGTVPNLPSLRVLPILHPAAILRAWYQRAVTVHDLRTRVPLALRGMWEPPRGTTRLFAPPTFSEATTILSSWLSHAERIQASGGSPLRLSHDIETARGLITCMGFADGPHSGNPDSPSIGLVIPFVRLMPGRQFVSYWTPQEEVVLARLIRKLLVHPCVDIEGQNYIYDTQYIQQFYGVTPTCAFDTMLAHHLVFPGTPKGLDYLSSLYCAHHVYWKDDNKDWDTSLDERRHLEYNGEDVFRTFECATELRSLIKSQGLEEQWEWEKRKYFLALRMMNRGVAIDKERRARYGFELLEAIQKIHSRLASIVPESLCAGAVKNEKTARPWYSSNKKQQHLFYDVLGLPRQTHRKTDRTTVDDEALRVLKTKCPGLGPVFDLLIDSRSLGVFYSTFVTAPLDPDGRMRCSFNPAGTETFRWSSSSNAFGRGTNLQNIPQGDEE